MNESVEAMKHLMLIFSALVTISCGGDETVESPTWVDLPLGSPCAGLGVCSATQGLVESDRDGGAICSTIPGGSADASSAEVCDEQDNDCNGVIDDVSDGRCDRCLGLSDLECLACENGDERGVFDSCAACGDCDRILGPEVDGFICGCVDSLDCPCGFICDEVDIGGGAAVPGCRPP
ncbi:MAG: hypothetical protein AAFQ82_17770 [Myxococcota bacterium]